MKNIYAFLLILCYPFLIEMTSTNRLPVAKYTFTLNMYSSSRTNIDRLDSTIPAAALLNNDKDNDIKNNLITQYNCVLDMLWNPDRHPNGFP